MVQELKQVQPQSTYYHISHQFWFYAAPMLRAKTLSRHSSQFPLFLGIFVFIFNVKTHRSYQPHPEMCDWVNKDDLTQWHPNSQVISLWHKPPFVKKAAFIFHKTQLFYQVLCNTYCRYESVRVKTASRLNQHTITHTNSLRHTHTHIHTHAQPMYLYTYPPPAQSERTGYEEEINPI